MFAAATNGGVVTFSSTEFGFYLRLEPGDELVRCLIQFAREQEVDEAIVSGVGAVTEVELGTGGDGAREHRRVSLQEQLEACSLTGTVTLVDGEPFPCLRGSFARADYSVLGGHVYLAVCGAGMNLAVHPVGSHGSEPDSADVASN